MHHVGTLWLKGPRSNPFGPPSQWIATWRSLTYMCPMRMFRWRHGKSVCFEELNNGEWYAHMPQFGGLWGQGQTKAEALEDMVSALPDWLRLELFGPPYLQAFHGTAKVVAKGRGSG